MDAVILPPTRGALVVTHNRGILNVHTNIGDFMKAVLVPVLLAALAGIGQAQAPGNPSVVSRFFCKSAQVD